MGAKHNLRRVVPNEGRNRIDATDYAHTVIRVTVKNGDVYVLDMAGAQYGWHEPVIPWQLYSASRVRGIKSVVPFGETRVFCKQRAQNLSEQQNWIHSIKESFAESVDDAVAKWQMANISSSDLLRLPDQEFLERQASLLDAVDGFMQQYKTFSESQGNYNISQGFQHGGLDRKITIEHRPSFSEWLAFMRDGTTPSG